MTTFHNNYPMGAGDGDVSPKEVECPRCCGNAICDGCGGSGDDSDINAIPTAYSKPCKVCKGNGECPKCTGTGNVLKSEIED